MFALPNSVFQHSPTVGCVDASVGIGDGCGGDGSNEMLHPLRPIAAAASITLATIDALRGIRAVPNLFCTDGYEGWMPLAGSVSSSSSIQRSSSERSVCQAAYATPATATMPTPMRM
jgi:hypothetical protein